ncbi:MAG: VWA domain-containing protein [Acidobacteriota bacterium]
MDFAAPHWLWPLTALPLLAIAVAFCWRRRLRATAAWAARGLWDRLLPTYHPRRLLLCNALLLLTLAGTVLALARPRWGATEQQIERRGVDLVFVLDTSLSMSSTDLAPSRLWVAQTLIRRLVEALPGHRVALVQAEGDSVVMMPLTSDAGAIELLLDAVQPGSLPVPGTDLETALQRGSDLFPGDSEKHRAMIVLSDGEDHGAGLGSLSGRLREAGVVVHAIGIGTLEGRPLELPRHSAADRLEYKRDKDGQVVVSRLIEEALIDISRDTGGVYLRATGAATDTQALTDSIQSMDRQTYDSEWATLREERFQWPATLSAAALTLLLGLSPFSRSVRRPEDEP